MNWIEKVDLINSEAGSVSNGEHFSLLCHSRDHKSFLDLEKKIQEGDIEAVNKIVSILKPQLEVYRKAIKAAKKYFAIGGEVKVNKSNYCSLLPLDLEKSGVLWVNSLYWELCPFKEQPKFFLWASRLLRDAEVRCLKHPMYRVL